MVNQHTVRVETEYKKVYSIIERPGAADLLQWMGANGFFEEIGRASCRERV